MAETDFTFHEKGPIPFYSCAAFEKIPGLHHGFSTRLQRNSSSSPKLFNLGHAAWDSEDNIEKTQRRFLSALSLDTSSMAKLRQIHSCRIHIIKEVSDKWNPPQGDALITGVKDIALSVRTADCFPVLIADRGGDQIAAVHSGWRGTLQQIVFHTVRLLQQSFSCNPSDFLVAIGPGIRSCCFEVGADVYDRFKMSFQGTLPVRTASQRPDKFLLDLPEILKRQLRKAGIHPQNIFDSGLCTCCNTGLFFSYRAEGDRSGRMMTVIGRV
jgi:YfiH family protein